MIRAPGFRILSELGSGGMGRVYLAELVDPDKLAKLPAGARIALKVLHPHLLEDAQTRQAFHQEAHLGSGIVHPNVVRTYGVIECENSNGARLEALALEYVPGQTVRALLHELGPLPEGLCRHIGARVAGGLSAIHQNGAIHRDIKPENLVLTPEHAVKIMDLGVARLVDQTLALSRTGQFVGTVRYAAPEQFSHPPISPTGQIDLFSLGIVLYELASGEHPFPTRDLPGYLRQLLHDEPAPLAQRFERLSPSFCAIVHALLAKAPRDRPPDAEAAREALLAGEHSQWWRSRPARSRPVRFIGRSLRVGRETAVHGRDEQMRQLQDAFARAEAGTGQVVVLEGEAGVGKTRLIDALVERLSAQEKRFRFLHGGYDPSGGSAPETPVLEAYRGGLGAQMADLETRLSEYPGLLAPLATLLRDGAPPDGVPRDRLHGALIHLLRSLAHESPVVLLIDDLHFASDEGRRLFLTLAHAASSMRILLIGATRPGAPAAWMSELARLLHAELIGVPRLDEGAMNEMLRELLGTTIHRHAAVITHRADGNPLFLLEMLRAIQSDDTLLDRTWRPISAEAAGSVPPILLPMMRARLAALSEEDRALLEVGACCGFEFDPVLIGEALGLPRLALLRSMARIERKDRLVHAEGVRYAFDHHLIQEALYQELSPPLRREYHHALAKALAERPEASTSEGTLERCRHLLRAERPQDARPIAQNAIDFAHRSQRHPLVVEIATALLQDPTFSNGAERAEILMRLAESYEHLGSISAERTALEDARVAAEATADLALEGRVRQQLGWLEWRAGDLAAARVHLEESHRLARAGGSDSDEAATRRLLANIDWSQGRYDEAHAGYEADLQYAQRTGDQVREAKAWSNLGNVEFHRGDVEKACRHYETSLEISRAARDSNGEARAGGNLAAMKHVLGQHGEARTLYESMLEIARKNADRPLALQVVGNLGGLLCDQGLMSEGLPYIEEAIALSSEMGMRESEGYARANLALYWLLVGELESAEKELRRAREIQDGLSSKRLWIVTHLAVARLHAVRGEIDAALALLEAVTRECETSHDEGNWFEARLLEFGILLGLETPTHSTSVSGHSVRIDNAAAGATARDPVGLNDAAALIARTRERVHNEDHTQRILFHLIELLSEDFPSEKERPSRSRADNGTLEESTREARLEQMREDLRAHSESFSLPSRIRANIYLAHASGNAADRQAARDLLELHLERIPQEHRIAARELPLHRHLLQNGASSGHRLDSVQPPAD